MAEAKEYQNTVRTPWGEEGDRFPEPEGGLDDNQQWHLDQGNLVLVDEDTPRVESVSEDEDGVYVQDPSQDPDSLPEVVEVDAPAEDEAAV